MDRTSKIETFACINHSSKTIIIAIPGTLNTDDLIKDLFLKFTGNIPKELIDSKKALINELEVEGYNLIFVGHSLGGALAASLAASFHEIEKKSIETVTFESPGLILEGNPTYDHIRDYAMLGPDPINALHSYPGHRHIVINHKLYAAFKENLLQEHTNAIELTSLIDLACPAMGSLSMGFRETHQTMQLANKATFFFDQHRLASFSTNPELASLTQNQKMGNIYDYFERQGATTFEIHPIERDSWLQQAAPIKEFHRIFLNPTHLSESTGNTVIETGLRAVSGNIGEVSAQLLQSAEGTVQYSMGALRLMIEKWIDQILKPLIVDTALPEFASANTQYTQAKGIRKREIILDKHLRYNSKQLINRSIANKVSVGVMMPPENKGDNSTVITSVINPFTL